MEGVACNDVYHFNIMVIKACALLCSGMSLFSMLTKLVATEIEFADQLKRINIFSLSG